MSERGVCSIMSTEICRKAGSFLQHCPSSRNDQRDRASIRTGSHHTSGRAVCPHTHSDRSPIWALYGRHFRVKTKVADLAIGYVVVYSWSRMATPLYATRAQLATCPTLAPKVRTHHHSVLVAGNRSL